MMARTAMRGSASDIASAAAPSVPSVTAGASRRDPVANPMTASASPMLEPRTRKRRRYAEVATTVPPMVMCSVGSMARAATTATASPPSPTTADPIGRRLTRSASPVAPKVTARKMASVTVGRSVGRRPAGPRGAGRGS